MGDGEMSLLKEKWLKKKKVQEPPRILVPRMWPSAFRTMVQRCAG